MKLITIEKENSTFNFVVSSRNTRSGFAHDCTLFVNGHGRMPVHCHYLNRTWETWTYQSACLTAISQEIESWEKFQVDMWKSENNVKRMSTKRRAEFTDYYMALNHTRLLMAVKDDLRTNTY